MINFAVINLKCTVKRIIKIAIIVLFTVGIVNISNSVKNIDFEISYVDLVKNNINSEINFENNLKEIIYAQIPAVSSSNSVENMELADSEETAVEETETIITSSTAEIVENLETENEESASLRNLSTEVVSENNISESYNTLYGSVKIKNETSFELTEEILTPNVEYTNINDIVIFHTHTCESYTATAENSYVASRKL